MSEHDEPDDGMEEIEIDVNHPWVYASTMMKPQPVLSSVSIDAIEFKHSENEEPVRAALLTVVDATGIKNVFLPPEILHGILLQGGQVMQQWAKEDVAKPKLIVADKNVERSVIQEQKIHQHVRDGKPNHLKGI